MLALTSWGVALFTLATPGRIDRHGILKGVDFSHFYVFGGLVADGRLDALYDWPTWRAEYRRLFADAPGLLYLPNYAPPVGLLFAPLSRLPYLGALAVWTAISALIYALSVGVALKRLPPLGGYGGIVAIVALAYPPLWQLLLHGQVSAIILASVTLAWLAIRAGRPFAAGLALAGLVVKPQYGLLVAMLLVAGEWAAVAGAAAGVLGVIGVTMLVLGPGVMREYVASVPRIVESAALFEPKVWQTHSLKGTLDLALGPGRLGWSLYGAAAVAGVWCGAGAWRHGLPADVRFACLLLFAVVLSPHAYIYDLVILAPALLVLSAWVLDPATKVPTRQIAILLAAVYLLPILNPLAAVLRVQPAGLALVGLTWAVWRTGAR